MNNKMLLPYLILMITTLFSACRGPEVKENNTSAGLASLRHVSNEKYVIDKKKFPVSTFVITKVEPANDENINLTGNLTIKGITHAVTFPAKIEVKHGMVNANGKVIIDRTKWDVRYNSGKFYDNLADQTISDDIEFGIKIVARK